MGAMKALSDATNTFVLGVDHFGKTADVGTRGSSVKETHPDAVLALLADKTLAGAVENTKVTLRKIRDGAQGRRFHSRRRSSDLALTRTAIRSARL